MRIAVFGATGRTGRVVVIEAVLREHSVIAISRGGRSGDVPGRGVEWRAADMLDPGAVRAAIRGAEAVVVCIGPTGDEAVCGRGTETVLEAMRELGVGRIACVTGAMIGHSPARLGWILRQIRARWRAQQPAQAADRDAQERALRASGIPTTIVRPTRLVGGEATGALVSDEGFVSSLASSRREDVAAALLDGVEGRLDRSERTARGLVVLSRPPLDGGFLARWTAAHALGEMLGLSAVAVATMLARTWTRGSIPAALTLGASAGLIEGAVVAGLLGAVLVSVRPEVRLGALLRWTAVGTVLCWGLGSLPSALMHAREAASPTPPSEPSGWWVALAAAGLGLATGPILGALQARALRPLGLHVFGWIAATTVGWVVAMPIVFAAAGEAWSSPRAVARSIALLGCAGAVVGLATGAALIANDRRSAKP